MRWDAIAGVMTSPWNTATSSPLDMFTLANSPRPTGVVWSPEMGSRARKTDGAVRTRRGPTSGLFGECSPTRPLDSHATNGAAVGAHSPSYFRSGLGAVVGDVLLGGLERRVLPLRGAGSVAKPGNLASISMCLRRAASTVLLRPAAVTTRLAL